MLNCPMALPPDLLDPEEDDSCGPAMVSRRDRVWQEGSGSDGLKPQGL